MMSLKGQQQSSGDVPVTSAFCSIATKYRTSRRLFRPSQDSGLIVAALRQAARLTVCGRYIVSASMAMSVSGHKRTQRFRFVRWVERSFINR